MTRGTTMPPRGRRVRQSAVLASTLLAAMTVTVTGAAPADAVRPWQPQRHVLSVPGDGWSARLRAATRTGVVLGALFAPGAPEEPRVGVWTDGVLRDLGPGDPVDVNDRGDVVASRGGSIVRWPAGQDAPLVLPLPAGTSEPVAVEANTRGDVAGTVLGADGRRRVVLWAAAGGVSDLGPGVCREEWDQARVVRLTDDATIIGDCGTVVLIGRHGRLERLPREPSAAARREGRWLTGGVSAVSSNGRYIATGYTEGAIGEIWERGSGVIHTFTMAGTYSEDAGDHYAMSGDVLGINEKGQVLLHYLGSPRDEDYLLTWDAEHGLAGGDMGDGGTISDRGDMLTSSGLIGSVTWHHDGAYLALTIWNPWNPTPWPGYNDCLLVPGGRLACTEEDAVARARIVLWS